MSKRFEYTPILGWSISRYDLFQICKRKYYYNYYGKFDPDIPFNKIKSLKDMTSIPLSIGIIVHITIKALLERLIRTEDSIDEERFYDYAKRKTEEYFNFHTFMETYYGDRKNLETTKIYEKVKLSLSNFIKSDRFNWLLIEAIPNKNNWIIEPPGFGETRIEGMKAYCKVDFLFPVDNNTYIIDWKTGKHEKEKHTKQLIGYTSWASSNLEIDTDKIIPIIAHLQPEYSEIQLSLNNCDIEEFINLVQYETKEMHKLCSNIEENIPKEKEFFNKTSNNTICIYCNFKELCHK